MSTEGERVGSEIAATIDAASESAKQTTESVIDSAKSAVDAANKRAEDIAAAAMNTALGERVAKHEQEIAQWHEKNNSKDLEIQALKETQQVTTQTLNSLSSTLTTLMEQLKAPLSEKSDTTVTAPLTSEASEEDRADQEKPKPKPQRTRLFL